MRHRRRSVATPLPAFLLLAILTLPLSTSAGAQETATREKAMEISDGLLAKLRSVAGPGAVTLPDLAGARADGFFSVHDPEIGEAIYGLVPIRRDETVIGIIGVGPRGEAWRWFTFSYREATFPLVPESEARERVRADARSRGLPGPEDPGTLVRGYDKRVYWRFDSSEETTWLVDTDRREAELLRSVDRSAAKALTPRLEQLPPRSGGGGIDGPGKSEGDRALPPAYNITGVPYHYQIIDWYCGPASLQMILDHAGEEISQFDIGDVANEDPSYGVYTTALIRSAHFSGMSTAIQNPSLQGYDERKLGYGVVQKTTPNFRQLRQLVSRNRPVVVLTWYDEYMLGGHFRVVKGYDNNLGVVVLHDPWFGTPYWGPDLIMNQTYFADTLWVYSYDGFAVCPWELTPAIPAEVDSGDTFTVSLDVVYPGSDPFNGQFPCTTCVATIGLPVGFALDGGSASQALPDMATGDTASVSWQVIAESGADEYEIGFQAQGIVSWSAHSYPTYSDSIGGHALRRITVGPSGPADWEDELRLTNVDGSSCTAFPGGRAIAEEADGTIHVVWADTRDGDSEIYYLSRVSGVWQAETRLTSSAGLSDSPAIAVDENGTVHVAWVDTRDGVQEIYYKYDAGGGWSADQRVTTCGEPDRAPAIAAGGGHVYLAWERYDGGYDPQVAQVAFSVRTGAVWSVPAGPEVSATKESYRPSLVWGADGLLHLVYEFEGSTVERQTVRHRSWNGTTWSAAVDLSGDSSYSRGPVIAAWSDSSLHVVWQDGENVPADIFYAEHDGLSWQAAEQIVTGSGEVSTPSVAVADEGVVWVAYADHRHGEAEIYVVDDASGRGWSEGTRLSFGAGASILPSIATGGAGEVCLVWTDARHGHSEVYFRNNEIIDTGVEAADSRPVVPAPALLSAPAPAPFSSETRFLFTLPVESDVTIDVFDLAGRRVRSLAAGLYGAGSHIVRWDGRNAAGRDAAAGTYFVRCETSQGVDVRRVVLVR